MSVPENSSEDSDRIGLSIVVPVGREEETVGELVRSVETNLPPELFSKVQLVLVSEKKLSSRSADPLLRVENSTVAGRHPNRKRNEGFSRAEYEIVAVLDDDVKVSRSWFETIHDWYHRRGYRGILTGPSSLDYRDTFRQKMASAVFRHPFTSLRKTEINKKLTAVGHLDVAFCNCVIPLSVYRSLGELDELSHFHVDDTIFFNRVASAGVSIFNHPGLKVAHRRRDFFLSFYLQLFRQKFYLGRNLVNHPELFKRDWIVWTSLTSVIWIGLILALGGIGLLLLLLGGYLAAAWLANVFFKNLKAHDFLAPPFVLIANVGSLAALYLGVIAALAGRIRVSAPKSRGRRR